MKQGSPLEDSDMQRAKVPAKELGVCADENKNSYSDDAVASYTDV